MCVCAIVHVQLCACVCAIIRGNDKLVGTFPGKLSQSLSLHLLLFTVFVRLIFPSVLCADRVGQMTKTYNDIDAVTRLLEEVRKIYFCLFYQFNSRLH